MKGGRADAQCRQHRQSKFPSNSNTPKDQGIRISASLCQAVEGELDKKDNEKTAKVEIVDRKTKVLLFASGPARGFIFLRNQLFRDKGNDRRRAAAIGRPGISGGPTS